MLAVDTTEFALFNSSQNLENQVVKSVDNLFYVASSGMINP